MEKKILTKDDILSADDRGIEEVSVPEWGGVVYVRSMSGRQKDAFELSCYSDDGKTERKRLTNFRARLLALTICGPDGTLLFSEKDVNDLGQKSVVALDRVLDVAKVLNGITKEAQEELVKKSEDSQDLEEDLDSV